MVVIITLAFIQQSYTTERTKNTVRLNSDYCFKMHVFLFLSVQYTAYSSIGQNIKSHTVSGLRYTVSVLRPECEKLHTAITQQRVIRSPSYLVQGWGFRGRRIERRHFWLDQIQDGGQWPF